MSQAHAHGQTAAPMTPEAKALLSTTIRGLRAYLLGDAAMPGALHAAVEGTYRMSIPKLKDAGLAEAPRIRRGRLERWIDEQVRIEKTKRGAADDAALRLRFRKEAEKQAAYTLLNRLIIVRLLEARGLRGPHVVTKGIESAGYKAYRQLAPALKNDDSEGYAFLLQLIFDDLAIDLPGLFGTAGVADLVPVPASALKHIVTALDEPGLASCFTDDMTLGWVYQYWNDPEREALDAKLNDGGKVEPHEIASKTQMFTERYMVDWLLQNSLGPMWLAMCQKHGWVAGVVKDGVLDALEARRVDWRQKRDRQEVSLTELMPLYSESERRWAYYLPQALPADAVASAVETVRDLKVLDPAVGSGHFLVVAFDLLFALYQEEARHRGLSGDVSWQPKAIVERILENNLHGIDLDPRAVQIAAASLWMKAQQTARDAHPRRLNLVASSLRLANLPDSDPALVELRAQIESDTGIPPALTDTVVQALRGADHLGSLLKVDRAVDDAIAAFERPGAVGDKPVQGGLFGETKPQQLRIDVASARQNVLASLETFLARHTQSDELGLRLHGEQLATGVRFVRLLREGQYDLVVGNPPYQGTAKMRDASYVARHYPRGKADLYAAFLERGLQLVRPGGTSSMVTMRNWMFIKQYAAFREWILGTCDLRALGDVSWGAFEDMRDNPVALSIVRRASPAATVVAVDPGNAQERSRTAEELLRKRAAMLAGVGRHDFEAAALRVVPEWPLVYWLSESFLIDYRLRDRVGQIIPAREGITTANNVRFRRNHWEVINNSFTWPPLVAGAVGQRWISPVVEVIDWRTNGIALKNLSGASIRNERFQGLMGVAFTTIGANFGGRKYRVPSMFEAKGRSIFAEIGYSSNDVMCLLNKTSSRRFLESINPSIDFTVGDVNRLSITRTKSSKEIGDTLDSAFSRHESGREVSLEFSRPGPSAWRHAQTWAQAAVDRADGEDLPDYVEVLDPEPDTDHVSFAVGVALGRFFGDGGGIVDPATADLSAALPAGLCFLDGTLDDADLRDSLGHPACALLRATWAQRGAAIDAGSDLRSWLRLKFFSDVHKGMYENRPIHWPLSSKQKTFVAWVNIHRLTEGTLRVLLADHLEPLKKRLDGELVDLRAARDGADKKAAKAAEKRFAQVQKSREELVQFIDDVTACAERGAPPTDAACAPRAKDARYAPDLDDGVMINSAALWPLLEPQWKDPKKWWKELSNAAGKKNYDWSHLAMRYWPVRVDAQCQADPSLGVAHGCFWRYHPARAWAWELRLQDEIKGDFRIEEKPYRGGTVTDDTGDAAHRDRYVKEHGQEALDAVEKEVLRRLRKQKKAQPTLTLLEPGLWSALPQQCWALELRVSEKQGSEFCLRAPDEAAARAAYVAAHPEEAVRRAQLLANLQPAGLFAGDDEEDTGAEDDADGGDDDDA